MIMSGSGLQAMWEQVYAPKSVKHLINGHEYSRALRVHMLTIAAIISNILETSNCLSGIDVSKLQLVYDSLIKGECMLNDILDEPTLIQITQIKQMEVVGCLHTKK